MCEEDYLNFEDRGILLKDPPNFDKVICKECVAFVEEGLEG
jgi:hypothetical protein